jgi:hypothetical protein
MGSPLTTKWVQLLRAMYRRPGLMAAHQQKIYSPDGFHKIMKELQLVGWVSCESGNGPGCVKLKRYALTLDGSMAVKLVLNELP